MRSSRDSIRRKTRETTVKNVVFAATAAAFLALSPATPAKADMTDLEIIFVKGDQNGDLVLNKAEVLLIAITSFNVTDSDRDNMLEKQEVGELASNPEFSDNDTNRDEHPAGIWKRESSDFSGRGSIL